MSEILAAALEAVKPTESDKAAERGQLEAQYASYSDFIEANADLLADEAEAYDSYESGYETW